MPDQNLIGEMKKRSAWSIFMGVLTAVIGVFLIVYPMAAATITTVLLGWAMVLVGVAQFVFAIHSQTPGKFLLKALLGVLYAICGLVLAIFPLEGVAALTLLLASFLVAYAVVGIFAAFQARPITGWGWLLFDALATLFVGILILARWPSSSLWAIGTLIGVSVLMGGISRIMIAAKIRSGVGSVERTVRAA